jgi:Arc/MetJ-type ribon-helix-helix transcriptional regulator
MKKTTVYLPDELKRDIERVSRDEGRSEADVIREAISAGVRRRAATPRVPLVTDGLGDPSIARRVDELLEEFGR